MTLTGPADLAPGHTPFAAAIFDFDGTIAESSHVWRLVDETFLSRRGIAYEPGFSAQLAARGFKEGARWVIGTYGLPDTVKQVCDEWNDLGSALYREQVCLRPGVEAYIRALRAAGVACALATNNDAAVLDALKPRVDVDALFDLRVHGAEVGRDKRWPDIYVETVRRMGQDPARTVVFEDIPTGLRSASSAGFTAVGVRSDDPTQDLDAVRAEAALVIDGWEGLTPR